MEEIVFYKNGIELGRDELIERSNDATRHHQAKGIGIFDYDQFKFTNKDGTVRYDSGNGPFDENGNHVCQAFYDRNNTSIKLKINAF